MEVSFDTRRGVQEGAVRMILWRRNPAVYRRHFIASLASLSNDLALNEGTFMVF